MNDIERNIQKGKILLDFYHYIVPGCAVYLLGEMYKNRFEDKCFLKSVCILEKICYNLLYFNNHFVSRDGKSFISEIRNMLFVKKYPFGIIYHNYESDDYNLIFGQRGKSVSFIIFNRDNVLETINENQLEQELQDKVIEWYVIIPPQKNLDKFTAMSVAFVKSVRYLLEHIYKDDDYSQIQTHYKNYIDFLKYYYSLKPDVILEECIREYERIYDNYDTRREILKDDEKQVISKLYEYANKIMGERQNYVR